LAKQYDLDARIKGPDNLFSPFRLSVSQPKQANTGEYVCVVDCPFVFPDEKRIYGATAEQAMALALWLVDDQLQHRECVLIGEDGTAVKLPIDRDAGVPGNAGTANGSK
jgi:hypothetical protein